MFSRVEGTNVRKVRAFRSRALVQHSKPFASQNSPDLGCGFLCPVGFATILGL